MRMRCSRHGSSSRRGDSRVCLQIRGASLRPVPPVSSPAVRHPPSVGDAGGTRSRKNCRAPIAGQQPSSRGPLAYRTQIRYNRTQNEYSRPKLRLRPFRPNAPGRPGAVLLPARRAVPSAPRGPPHRMRPGRGPARVESVDRRRHPHEHPTGQPATLPGERPIPDLRRTQGPDRQDRRSGRHPPRRPAPAGRQDCDGVHLRIVCARGTRPRQRR